jgi:hypothetical protein
MIDRVDAIMTFASVVLGAVLALAGGVWTERWKQRKEVKAAARLVWLELGLGHAWLCAAVALDKWPAEFAFSDDAWIAQRDRLALVRSVKQFQDLQKTYFMLGALARGPASDRNDPVLYWPALVTVDRAFSELAGAAGVRGAELDALRVPLQKRLAKLRTGVDRMNATPEAQEKLIDDAETKALDGYPLELRARAAEAYARLNSRKG